MSTESVGDGSPYDLTFLEIETEQGLLRTHGADQCSGRPCVIHSPSPHKMVTWPMRWHGRRYLMERVCAHDIGHPDPDHLAFIRELEAQVTHSCEMKVCPHPNLSDSQAEHDCDGCCDGSV